MKKAPSIHVTRQSQYFTRTIDQTQDTTGRQSRKRQDAPVARGARMWYTLVGFRISVQKHRLGKCMADDKHAERVRCARNTISDKVIQAMGRSPARGPGKLLVPVVRMATTHFARLMAVFDRHVGDLGTQEAARRLLPHLVEGCRQCSPIPVASSRPARASRLGKTKAGRNAAVGRREHDKSRFFFHRNRLH